MRERWTCAPSDTSPGITLPGFMIPSGSRAAFTARITSSATGSLRRAMEPSLWVPTPCPAEKVPPSDRTTSPTACVMRSSAAASRWGKSTVWCTLPSPRCAT